MVFRRLCAVDIVKHCACEKLGFISPLAVEQINDRSMLRIFCVELECKSTWILFVRHFLHRPPCCIRYSKS